MKRVYKPFLIVAALVAVLVGLIRPAAAQGIAGTITSEGIMPWRVVKTDGTVLHVRLSPDKDLVGRVTAKTFADYFNMSMDELRNANREFTLAVCLDGGKPRRAPPIRGNVDRASDEIWVNCKNRDLWLIPGSEYVMKKMEGALPYGERQEAIRTVASCGTAPCMGEAGYKLAEKYDGIPGTSGTAPSAPAEAPAEVVAPPVVAAPPAVAAAPAIIGIPPEVHSALQTRAADLELKSMEQKKEIASLQQKLADVPSTPVVASTQTVVAPTKQKTDWAFIGVVFLFALALLSAFWQNKRANRADAEKLKLEHGMNEFCVEEAKRQKSEHGKLIKEEAHRLEVDLEARLQTRLREKQSIIESQERLIEQLKVAKGDLAADRQRVDRDHTAALEAANTRAQDATKDLEALQGEVWLFIQQLYMRMGAGVVPDKTDDIYLAMEATLNEVGEVDQRVLTAINAVGVLVDGEASHTRSMPFETARLEELATTLKYGSDQLMAYAQPETEALIGRIRDCVSDSTLTKYRKRLEDKAFEKAELDRKLKAAEAHCASLEQEKARLAAQVSGYEAVRDMGSIPPSGMFDPATQSRMPELASSPSMEGEAPAEAVSEEDGQPSSDVSDSDRPTRLPSERPMLQSPPPPMEMVAAEEGSQHGGPQRKHTLVPGMFRPGSVRSQERADAFDGLDRWNAFTADTAIIAIEDDSELEVLSRLAVGFKRRRLQCLDEHGSNMVIELSALTDPAFRQTLRAHAPSV